MNNWGSYNRVGCSQIRLSEEPEPLLLLRPYAPSVLPRCSLAAPFCSLTAPSKAALLLSHPGRAIANPKFGVYIIYIYIYIIYTPNLGSEVALPGREREHGRFRGSTEGAISEHGGALREQIGSTRQCRGAVGGSLKWGLFHLGLSCFLMFFCCLDFATFYRIL